MGSSKDSDSDVPLSQIEDLGLRAASTRGESVITTPGSPFEEGSKTSEIDVSMPHHPVQPGEVLQLVRFVRRGATLTISGVTPHGRRLTFEQREDRDGWYVVVAGRRRRPTERELGLVVASITQEMEAALVPEGESGVRSAYRLAAFSDQPGVEVLGLPAYRDLLLDEAAGFIAGETERLAVVAVQYQAFKRFANRHGHRIGAAFVRALGERLADLFSDQPEVTVCHKSGKAFRLIVRNLDAARLEALVERICCDETRQWLVERVWGEDKRTHPDEVHFYIGIAKTTLGGREEEDYVDLAQRLNDDAFRAAKLGQLRDHRSVLHARTEYKSSIYRWSRHSEAELAELAAAMDEGPAEVMAEMQDYLHELVPVDLEGMAVEGNVSALIHAAIARDGFWQGTTAMRLVGAELVHRFLHDIPPPEGQNEFAGGFDLGDEFYAIAIEKGRLYFAWGDLNSAGATRVKAGLAQVQHAAGWRREDGGGIVGRFLHAVGEAGEVPLVDRVRAEAEASLAELSREPALRVNDAVDIADFLWTADHELAQMGDVAAGAKLQLILPSGTREIEVLERQAAYIARLSIDGEEHAAAISESPTGLSVKLRIRDAIISPAVCIIEVPQVELLEMLAIVREDNDINEDAPLDVLGFLRHVADILLTEYVKGPGKIELALGAPYTGERFIKVYSLENVREQHPGLFYEAVHHSLLEEAQLHLDAQLVSLVVDTMLARTRPQWTVQPRR